MTDVLIASVAFLLPGLALAQANYPAKPLRWIVPYAAGGGTDLLARAVGQKLAAAWGQQVIVDNRPGGGTNVGAELAAKSVPDGYTLFSPGVANAINVTLFRKLHYDIVRDFVHITNLAKIPGIVVVHPSLPVRNLRELIALAKARPDDLRHGSPGIGSPQHLTAELMKSLTGVRMVHVPYKGASPAITDAMGGHIEVYFGAIISTLPQVKIGRLRAIGITALQRVAAAPQLPTLSEQGLKGFETASWVLVSAPAGTAPDIINRIHVETVRALHLPDIRARLEGDGAQIVGDTPRHVTNYLKAEIDKWGKAVKASGARREG
jgi:tripartite-type tricarboxylate transporter receptor subunit TctC